MSLTASKDWPVRWQAVLEQILRIGTDAELDALLAGLGQSESPQVLAFVNAHAMNSLSSSERFFAAIQAADIVLRDGSGMATLYRMLGQKPGLNLNGTDLIPRIIRRFDGEPIALFGTSEPYLGTAKALIESQLAPRSSVRTEHGFLEAGAYVDLARQQRPALLVLGMGMPKQEELAIVLRSALTFPCLVVCGGAIIDFLGGKTARAPVRMQKAGVEWLFRLALEPRRLFQRYVIGNPLFLCRALRYRQQSRPTVSPSDRDA